jgi:hypothetical protein
MEILLRTFKQLLLIFLSWKTCHTKRRANSAAHIPGQVSSHNTNQGIWLGYIPDCIREVVLSKSSSLIL